MTTKNGNLNQMKAGMKCYKRPKKLGPIADEYRRLVSIMSRDIGMVVNAADWSEEFETGCKTVKEHLDTLR